MEKKLHLNGSGKIFVLFIKKIFVLFIKKYLFYLLKNIYLSNKIQTNIFPEQFK